jgi:hypothetical protein
LRLYRTREGRSLGLDEAGLGRQGKTPEQEWRTDGEGTDGRRSPAAEGMDGWKDGGTRVALVVVDEA